MEYRVLGRLEVRRDGEVVDLGAHRQRTLLAILLTNVNGVVALDEIIEALWGDDAGSDRQNALWVYVSGLRKALEPERKKRTDGTILLTRSPGYVLAAGDDAVDALQFEKLVAEGRSLADTDPAAASLVLGEALALWRGKPYEEFTYDSFFQTEIARLEELRLEAVESRIDADLDRGMSRQLVSELESLVREHPLRERLTGQLMMSLHRSGRQAEALRAYQMLSSRLGEELGIEPSASIRRLEERIVTGDADLDTPAGARQAGSGAEPGLTVRGYELRESIGQGAFGMVYRAYQPAVGREVAIKVIRPELADSPAFIRRFEAEAQLVARMEHPHIVPLYDYWREPGAAYLVMRLMQGGSLADVLETSALSGRQASVVADQMAGALHAAHTRDVVHGDVKPSNILIDADGNAYLSDFGIAMGTDGRASRDPSFAGTLAAPYASPEQLADGETSPSSDLFSLGVVLAQALSGLHGDVAQIRGALEVDVASVIDRATDPVRSRRYQTASAFLEDFKAAVGEQGTIDVPLGPPVDLPNPYKGLRSFGEADAGHFFGRERLIDRLLYRLGEPGARGRFVALVGPSGSGKSSVVKAGLRPALASGAIPLSDEWFTVEMVPAPHPFEELESALMSVAVDPPTSLLEQLTMGEEGLVRTVARIMPDDGSQLLLIIDQFEEIFTQVDPATAERFIESLVTAVTDPHSRIRVVITLRADFYDRPLRHQRLGELVRDATEAITPMTADELERAITGPVDGSGVSFEPALVAALVRDVVGRPSALPLLQYTLTELFDGRTTSRIAAAAYEELGGVSGALVSRAEGLVSSLSDDGRDTARQVFLRLVTLGEGADDTRRRVLRSELEDLPVGRGELDTVLDTFGRHRLLSFDRDPITRGPTVEIAHEAMLIEWTRLRHFIDGARHDVRSQRRLADAMAEWESAGRADDYLLRGGVLDQLNGWATTTTLPLSASERAFLDASVADRDRMESEGREREQRAVDAERRARRRFRELAAVGAVALVVAALAVYAFVQQREATSANEERDSLLAAADLASQSVAAVRTDPELALLLGLESLHATTDLGFASEESVDAIHWALQELRVPYDVTDSTPVAVRPGPSGLSGVWVLPPAELAAMAEAASPREFTAEECTIYLEGPCPERGDIQADLPLRRGDEAYGAVPFGPGALAGTNVDYLGEFFEGVVIDDEFAAFTEQTGVRVTTENAGFGGTDVFLGRLAADDNVPDVASFFGAQAHEFADDALELGRFLDPGTLRSDFTPFVMSLATVGPDGSYPAEEGRILSIPLDLDVKGLVYYPQAAFEAAGYEIPRTLDELLDLSHRMVADGRTPWCFAFNSAGPLAGWPGTDIVEALVARFGGVETFDDWVSHEIPFDHPSILRAGAYLEELVFENGFVRNGPESISATDFGEGLFPMLREDDRGESSPECWLYAQSDVMFAFSGADAEIGTDLGVFFLPPVEEGDVVPVTGGGAFATQLRDKPEVRLFMEWMASPDFGIVQAGLAPSGTFIAPNARFDVDAYRNVADPNVSPAEIELRIELASVVRDALNAGRFRFDGSDFMPERIGLFNSDGSLGPFFQGMLDFTDGVRSIDEVFADIEAAWVALEAEGA